MGLRRSFWLPFFGVPQGWLGQVGARLMPRLVAPLYASMSRELDLQPDDDLLDVGCGSARMLAEQAAHLRFVAGLDASDIQVEMARKRLADRLAAGTAEIVQGDATALPWEDGRFSVVSSLNCLKFVPDPQAALREMCRVLRPGGRVALTCDEDATRGAGEIDAFGQWQWSAEDMRQMLAEAGFADVSVERWTRLGFQLARGTRPQASGVTASAASPDVGEAAEAPAQVEPAGD